MPTRVVTAGGGAIVPAWAADDYDSLDVARATDGTAADGATTITPSSHASSKA